MVIETFRQGAAPIYERFAEKGRQAPDGLTYLDSWIDAGLNRLRFALLFFVRTLISLQEF